MQISCHPFIVKKLANKASEAYLLIVKYAKAVAKYSTLISALHSRLTVGSESTKPV